MKRMVWVGLGFSCAATVLAPLAHADSGAQYFKTPWGTRCQVTAATVVCDTCEPGVGNTYPGMVTCGQGPENDQYITNTAGVEQDSSTPGILGPSPGLQQIVAGQTYRANGWTITTPISGNGVHFTNDTTGHGMAVAPMNRYWF